MSAEWGIRCITGPFQILAVPLPTDDAERRLLLTIICHLYNFRTRRVPLNHITTTFDEEWVPRFVPSWVKRKRRYFDPALGVRAYEIEDSESDSD